MCRWGDTGCAPYLPQKGSMAPHPPQTTRAWVGTTKRWASMPTTRLGSAIVSGGFHGIPSSITEGSARLQQYPCRRFTPGRKSAKTSPKRKLALPKLFSHASGQRRLNAVRCASPIWGFCEGSTSSAAHRRRLFSDLQTASTRADCEQSTSPAPLGSACARHPIPIFNSRSRP